MTGHFTAKRAQRLRWALFLVGVLGLSGCKSGGWIGDNRELARDIAGSNGFVERRFDAGLFVLAGFEKRGTTPQKPLVVYIEGDGHAWSSRYHISPDPTPWNPVSLRLAVQDSAPNVLYLARPCQFTVGSERRNCSPAYWTTHRFAPEVIESANKAIERVKAEARASGVALVGYSGGGSVAALVAAERSDVVRLTTLAANLDHALWTRQHEITPLSGSLNAADVASRLQEVPQVHFIGGSDDVVPASVIESYVRRMTDTSHVRTVVVPGYDHDCCWIEAWPDLNRQSLLAESR